MTAPHDPQYWKDLGGQSEGGHRQPLWRTHSDAVNGAWLAERLPPATAGPLLKTDLFDEALALGLYPLLADRAPLVIGIDVANSTIDAARARHGNLRGVCGDVRALPFATASIATVVSTSTLDHFGSLEEITVSLRELHRVLRPDGRLLLTLDNLANPLVAARNTLPFPILHAAGIVPYRIGKTAGPLWLRRSIRNVGFDVLEVSALLHCPRVLAVAGAALLHRLGSPEAQRRYVDWLQSFENLNRWPSRFLTGYYIGVVARKR